MTVATYRFPDQAQLAGNPAFTPYLLPDNSIIMADASAVKGAFFIDYAMADGSSVQAMRFDSGRKEGGR